MGSLPERKARTIYVTGSFVMHNGRRRKVMLESRPEYAVLKLIGTKTQYPIAWEALFDVAAKHHAENVRVEALPQKERKVTRGVKKK